MNLGKIKGFFLIQNWLKHDSVAAQIVGGFWCDSSQEETLGLSSTTAGTGLKCGWLKSFVDDFFQKKKCLKNADFKTWTWKRWRLKKTPFCRISPIFRCPFSLVFWGMLLKFLFLGVEWTSFFWSARSEIPPWNNALRRVGGLQKERRKSSNHGFQGQS